MAINIRSLADFWVRTRGDSLAGNGSGTSQSNAAAFEQYNRDIGEQTDPIASTDAGTASLISLLKRLLRKTKTSYSTASAPSPITNNLSSSQQLFNASSNPKIIENATGVQAYVLLGSGTASQTHRTYAIPAGGVYLEDFEGVAQVACASGASGQINITELS